MKRLLAIIIVALVAALPIISRVAAASPAKSPVTFRLVSGLPRTMQVGQSYTVTVKVTSTTAFTLAQALPDDQFPGKGVNASGGDRSGGGTSATLNVTFTAVSSTSSFPDGKDHVAVVAGVRFANGPTVSQRYDFSVAVP
jgi:hypothetical protein